MNAPITLRCSQIFWTAVSGIFLLAPAPVQSQEAKPEKIMVVLDASGSMQAKIGDRTKMEIAKNALAELVAKVPRTAELGLMAYGHRSKGDCQDIEVLVEPAAESSQAILSASRSLKPLGKTPISAAVTQAAEALKYTEDKATVILISDGEETCEMDPCAVAKSLESQGIGFTAHVIGFDIADPKADAQLRCLAEGTGGQYFPAKDARGLVEALSGALRQTVEVKPTPEPTATPEAINRLRLEVRLAKDAPLENEVHVEIHKPAQEGATETERVETHYKPDPELSSEVVPGKYILKVRIGEARAEVPVEIPSTKTIPIILNGARVKPEVVVGEGQPSPDGLSWELDSQSPNGPWTEYGSKPTFVVPAGEAELRVRLGEASVSQKLSLKAGETTSPRLSLEAGTIKVSVRYGESCDEAPSSGVRLDVLSHKKSAEGQREVIATEYSVDRSFRVQAGKYYVRATVGEASAEVEVEAKTGELAEPQIVLNAGVLAVEKTEGVTRLEVHGAKKSLDGTRKHIHTEYSNAMTLTLPAGKYIVTVYRDDASEEKPADITVCERTEIKP